MRIGPWLGASGAKLGVRAEDVDVALQPADEVGAAERAGLGAVVDEVDLLSDFTALGHLSRI